MSHDAELHKPFITIEQKLVPTAQAISVQYSPLFFLQRRPCPVLQGSGQLRAEQDVLHHHPRAKFDVWSLPCQEKEV